MSKSTHLDTSSANTLLKAISPNEKYQPTFPPETLAEALEKNKEYKNTIEILNQRISSVENFYKLKEEKWNKIDELNQVMLRKKTSQIDVMRVKLNRYEFAIKEAILFLAKPMEQYQAWLDNDPSKSVNFKDLNPSDPKSRTPSHQTPAQLAQNQQSKGMSIKTGTDKLQTPSSAGAVEISGLSPILDQNIEITSEQISSLECIRLALNYLKSAQISVQALIIKATSSPTSALSVLPSDFELEIKSELQNDVYSSDTELESSSEAQVNAKSGHSKHERHESEYLRDFGKDSAIVPKNPNTTDILIKQITERYGIVESKAAAKYIEEKSLNSEELVERDGGDIAFGTDEDTSSFTTQKKVAKEKKCENCHELMLRIDHYQDQVGYLKRDITQLVNQLNDERSCRQRVQLSKDILDQELEELTAQLFDQANRMVIDEATIREQFENSNYVLKGELKDLSKKFENREDELRDLKRFLVALEAAKQRSVGLNGSPRSSQTNISSGGSNQYYQNGNGSFFSSRIGPDNSLTPFIPVDGIIFGEFQDHIKVVMSSMNLPMKDNIQASMQTSFLKRSMIEDIEPCLYYSYQNFTNSIKANQLSTSLKKKLLDSVVKNWCDIKLYWSSKEELYLNSPSRSATTEVTTDVDASPSYSSKNPPPLQTNTNDLGPPKKRCNNCGIVKECDYRIRFVIPEKALTSVTAGPRQFSEWNPICRFCRDRVTAVSDFFLYMTHLRQGAIGPGKKGVTILGMFRHTLWLKRKMAVARVGSCSLFDGDVVSTFENRESGSIDDRNSIGGHGGDWERLVSVIHSKD